MTTNDWFQNGILFTLLSKAVFGDSDRQPSQTRLGVAGVLLMAALMCFVAGVFTAFNHDSGVI